MLETDYPEVSGWYPFFDELKEIGMNTVVIAGIAGFPKPPRNWTTVHGTHLI